MEGLLVVLAALPFCTEMLQMPVRLELGAISPGQVRVVSLPLTNETARFLELAESSAECECISTEVSGRSIPPFSCGRVRVQVAPCVGSGDMHRHVAVDTADGTRLRTELHYRIAPQVFASPEIVRVGPLPKQGWLARIAIDTTNENGVQLLAVTSQSDLVDCWLEEYQVTPGHAGSIGVGIGAPTDTLRNTEIIVLTSSKEAPEVRIPLRIAATSGVEFDPPFLDFSEIPRGAAHRLDVKVQLDEGIRWNEVRSLSDSAEVVSIEPVAGGARIGLRTRPDLPLGYFAGDVSVEIVGKTHERVRLPYWGWVRESQR